MGWKEELERIAEDHAFSGVVSVSRSGSQLLQLCRGWADRRHRVPNDARTQFAMASVTKGLTAISVGKLVETGLLSFQTPVRSLLGSDLPRVDDGVTIEQLLCHTSGVGDYLDEDHPSGDDDYDLSCPVRCLNAPEDYLPLLDRPSQGEPGVAFKYNNSGYVILSIAIERASGRSFRDVVTTAVLEPAGMADTGFFRRDDLPPRAAVGYLTDGRSNVFHLPVMGAGDGGVYSTVSDLERFWTALFDGQLLEPGLVRQMTSPRFEAVDGPLGYATGFWVGPDRQTILLEGVDRGVSARTVFDSDSGLVYSVASNTMHGAWPIVRFLDSNSSRLA